MLPALFLLPRHPFMKAVLVGKSRRHAWALVCSCRGICGYNILYTGVRNMKMTLRGIFYVSDRCDPGTAVLQGICCFASFQMNIQKWTSSLWIMLATAHYHKEIPYLLFQRPWTFYHPLSSKIKSIYSYANKKAWAFSTYVLRFYAWGTSQYTKKKEAD